MSSLLNNAILLNNNGARLLSSGNTYGALELMRQAVVAMKECTSSPPVMSDPQSPVPNPSHDTCLPNDSTDCNDRPVSAFYVYQRPLMLPQLMASTPQEYDSLVGLVTTHLLFNLALTCHRYGMESGTSEPLRRAMELYQVVLESHCCTLPEESNDVITRPLFQCLVLNNLAHLHFEQCEYDYSEWCLGCLEQIMATSNCLGSTCVPCTLHHIVGEYEAEEIKLNLVFAQPPIVAHAA